ncbi:MAG TPA: glycosyltransferase family 2 protein [Verrucomicrobiae bacterium]|nr:glycosyltransferase family 2 protein [Verrucomicrobiae bacterium]
MVFAELMLAVIAAPALVASTYLLVLTLLSARLPLPPRSRRRLRFHVVVPARNEASTIARSLASLRQLDWPTDRFRLLVVADNCDDNTAALARGAGARVLERCDPSRRGKGYALQLAFEVSRETEWADAVAVVDSDSEVSPNLLEAFAARIESGAGVVQAHYGVLAPELSWRTRLIAIAHGAFHSLRSRARERLGLSCGLRGNGWCITHEMLGLVPYAAFSMTEDLEYGIALGLAGHRVHYAPEAHANADMAVDSTIARGQRQRWEGGRFALLRSKAWPLLRATVHRRSTVCLDLALDLLVLPLSYVTLNVLLLAATAAVAMAWHPGLQAWLWAAVACTGALLIYVLRGVQLSGRGMAGLRDLLAAPLFLLWKLSLLALRNDRRVWAPTRRQEP